MLYLFKDVLLPAKCLWRLECQLFSSNLISYAAYISYMYIITIVCGRSKCVGHWVRWAYMVACKISFSAAQEHLHRRYTGVDPGRASYTQFDQQSARVAHRADVPGDQGPGILWLRRCKYTVEIAPLHHQVCTLLVYMMEPRKLLGMRGKGCVWSATRICE